LAKCIYISKYTEVTVKYCYSILERLKRCKFT